MKTPERILLIMLRRIGDVVLTGPAARALRKLFPKARIDFLAEAPCHEVLEGDPNIDRVLAYQGPVSELWRARRERYDWVVDYMGTPRSAIVAAASGAALRAGPAHVFHRWAYTHRLRESPTPCYSALEKIRVLKGLGVEPDESDYMPRLVVPADSRQWAGAAAKDALGGDGPLVGLVPASRKTTRRWPASSYGALGRLLRERCGARLLVFWGPGEEALAQEVRAGVGGACTLAPLARGLKDLAALLGLCRLVVTNCNGPKHLAVACGVLTLTVHGSSDPRCWNPPEDPRHRVERLDGLHCIACRLNECPYALECFTGLSPERVARAAEDMLGVRAR